MPDPRHIHISDYQYDLPDERIAKFPVARRDQSKLLIYNKGVVGEDVFFHLPDYLPKGALMVFNNTKVIQARMHFRKTAANGEHTGALIEVFLLEPAEPADYEQMFQTTGHCAWYCLVGNLKKWKEGTLTRTLNIENGTLTIKATRGPIHGTSHRIDFEWNGDVSFATIIDMMGELPIPPYLNRETQDSDKTTYQTVYSKIKGSVAAPTAGLHFTPEVLADLDAHGIEREELTLHVGAGTFKPVKSEEMEGHEMHTEYISVRRETITKLLNHDCQAIAVGTTSWASKSSPILTSQKTSSTSPNGSRITMGTVPSVSSVANYRGTVPSVIPSALYRLLPTGWMPIISKSSTPAPRSSSVLATTTRSSVCSSRTSTSPNPRSCFS